MKKLLLVPIVLTVALVGCGSSEKVEPPTDTFKTPAPNKTSVFSELSDQINAFACEGSGIRNAAPVTGETRYEFLIPGILVTCQDNTTEFWEQKVE